MTDEPLFIIGDLVFHDSLKDEADDDRLVGFVTGFCPSPNWIRVKTLDGRKHIWLKKHVENSDYICREGNHSAEHDQRS